MEKVLFPQLAPEARLDALKKTALGTEKMSFVRTLTEAEIAAESKHLSELVQLLVNTEAEKASVVKEYTDSIKNTKTLMEASSQVLTRGEKDVTENVYKYINQETKEAAFYDECGNLVKVRPATAEELTPDMFGAGDVKALEAKHEAEDAEFEELEGDGEED